LRRLAGVNEPPPGGDWEPAAEILSRAFRGEGSLRQLVVAFQRRSFKDPEDEASQLNRLVSFPHRVLSAEKITAGLAAHQSSVFSLKPHPVSDADEVAAARKSKFELRADS
jgi:hypothetical protein